MIVLLATALAGDWTLGGMYDLTTVSPAVGESRWLWQPDPAMQASCGGAKSPDGIGVMEAQAIASRAMPVLAVVLHRQGGDGTGLNVNEAQIAVGRTRPEVRLAPAVMPRRLAVEVQAGGDARLRQLVRTQLAMELCLEHKTGRRWSGGNALGLRQAFLLNSPRVGEGGDRMYFRGQREPVSLQIGPPHACEIEVDAEAPTVADATSSLRLVPADVWGAALPKCEGTPPARGLPLFVGGAPVKVEPALSTLTVSLSGPTPEETRLTLMVDGREVLADALLLQRSGGRVDPDAPEVPGLLDVLASVPSAFPRVTEGDQETVVLLVPDWQIAEALGRIGLRSEAVDAVGWLLQHPEYLFVQVGDTRSATLPNLTSRFHGTADRFQRWGFTVGQAGARGDIVTLDAPPTHEAWLTAQGAFEHGLVLVCLCVMGALVPISLLRVHDLWAVIPEERMLFWPSSPATESEPELPDALGGGEAE